MRHVATRILISAPAERVWEQLARLEHWPTWGVSIRAVSAEADEVAVGLRGELDTVLGIRVPFLITNVDPGRSWAWRVAGIRATGHEVRRIDSRTAEVTFSVPWLFAPYVAVLRIALRRLKRAMDQSDA